MVACAAPEHIATDEQDVFQRAGRFSVSSEEISGKQNAVQGGFVWLDSGHDLSLDLSNPVGSIIARVNINKQGASLSQSDGTVLYADNADELITQAVGSNIPVSNLRNWMKGVVSNDATVSQYDDNKNITKFSEEGWHVSLNRYDEKGPKLLRMQRNEQGTKINVRLVVK